MLRATLYGTDTGERQMLFEHLDLLDEHDLLVLDRGYPASWLMAALQMRAIHSACALTASAASQSQRSCAAVRPRRS
jgi:hypothetical protein